MANSRSYKKRTPFRNASLFIIICEGSKREPEYFQYFREISSRIRLDIIPSENGKSSPNHLLASAEAKTKKNNLGELDELWFVIDTDKWGKQIHKLRAACNKKSNWDVAESNPCFEVWLYFHLDKSKPKLKRPTIAKEWKGLVAKITPGGFSSNTHPANIKEAIKSAEKHYTKIGYSPNVGSTQVFKLGRSMLPFLEKELSSI